MGLPIFGSGRLITSNATCTLEYIAGTAQVEGATVENYAVLAAGVPVLVTNPTGGRTENFGTDAERTGWKVTGVEVLLNRSDIRIRITATDNQPELVGLRFRVKSSQKFPAGLGGLLGYRIECECTVLEYPEVL